MQCPATLKVRTSKYSAEACCIQDAGHEGDHVAWFNFTDEERSDKKKPLA